MYELLRRLTLSFLKVPPEPHPPIGDPASLRVFRAGRNYYWLRLVTWAVAQVVALAAFVFWTAILVGVEAEVHKRNTLPVAAPTAAGTAIVPAPAVDSASQAAETPQAGRNWIERAADKLRSAAENVAPKDSNQRPQRIREWIAGYTQFFVELAMLLPAWVFPMLWVVKIVSFGIYVLQIPITYVFRRLDFEMRWYMVTDRSLRLRHGAWQVTESTMSFANIQQVVVIQGPLQRLLGLADVKVQSAGGGGTPKQHEHAGEDMHVGLFRHVTNAVEIRDLISERLRRFRESGLGDPDEKAAPSGADPTPVPASSSSLDALSAARELLAEARRLRAALE